MRPIRPSKLMAELEANAKANIPTMIWGPPGVGKSEIVYQLANKMQATLFELRANLFDPVDVRGGLKVVEQEDGSYKTKYGIPEDYPASDLTGPVVLFIDELANAPKATQNALLQLVLDKKIGTYQLPPQTIIVAAGNRAADRAAVNEMPTPVKNRFAHYEIEVNHDDWYAWAMTPAANVSPSIVSFLRFAPKHLHNMDVKEHAFPTPRSWSFVNRKLPFLSNDVESQMAGIAALIGDGPAGEFVTYLNTIAAMPDIDLILKTPKSAPLPTEMSIKYAVCGALAQRANDQNFDKIMDYLVRLEPEYQIIAVKDSMAKAKSILAHPSFRKWAAENVNVYM